MSFKQFRKQTPYRLYRILVQYLRNELDQPSRSDFYILQLTREVRLFRKMFNSDIVLPPSINEMKIPFSQEAQESLNPKMSDEESAALAKSHWRTIMGKPIKSTSHG